MKKRVRIYKSSDDEGKFINKTAQFLSKAQMGGTPNPDMMGYPGAAPQQSQEISENELASSVLSDISNSESREAIVIKLVNNYGKDPLEAQQFVDQMYAYVEQQKESEIDEAESEDDGTDSVTMGADTAEEAMVSEEEFGPTGTEMSNEIIDEWDSSGDDDNQAASDIIMRYGGYPKAQEGMEVPIEMPDISAYLPQGMSEYLNNNIDPISDEAWNRPAANKVTEEEQVFEDYTESQLPEEYRRGGALPSKRSYVSSIMKLAKKQMGGDSASKDFSDDADPTGADVRKNTLNKFIGSVKNQSAMALAKQQAEQQYEQMMQQQQMMQQYPMAQQGGQQPGDQNIYQGQDFENPMHHLALFSKSMGDVFQEDQNQITQAKFGGLFKNRKRNPYMNAINLAQSFGQGMPMISNIDVRKSGLFGRPRQYSIDFSAISPMPGMPGSNLSTAGTSSSIKRTPARRILIEDDAAEVNKESIEEVSEATPNSEATTKAAASSVNVVPDVEKQVVINNQVQQAYTPRNVLNLPEAEVRRMQNYESNKSVPKKINEANAYDLLMGPSSSRVKSKKETKPTVKPSNKNFVPTAEDYGKTRFQSGGSINNPFADQYGNLQQFIGGGDEDFTQGDLDDMYSKDTANANFPMARRGMNVRNLFPANIMPTQYTQMRGLPYDPRTGKAVTNFIPGAGTNIKNINVTKSGLISGRPKKYTVTFSNSEMDPRKQNLITIPSSDAQVQQPKTIAQEREAIDMTGVGMRGRMAIRQGERKVDRNDRRLARNPEALEPIFTPEQMATKRAFANRLQSNNSNGSDYPGMTQSQRMQLEMLMKNRTGVPNYNERFFQEGGDLSRFIPQAQNGVSTPVVYTNNPAYAGMSTASMISAVPDNAVNMSGLTGGTDLSFNLPGMSNQETAGFTGQQPIQSQIQIDPSQAGSHQIDKTYAAPAGDVSVDFKTKSSFDPEATINTINAGLRGATGLLNKRDDRMNQLRMMDNMSADNLYASDPSLDRGDYDTNAGLYRPDEMGQSWNSRSKQYGGNIYQDGGMVEGDEVFMTEDEIEEFLANGGDLEFI